MFGRAIKTPIISLIRPSQFLASTPATAIFPSLSNFVMCPSLSLQQFRCRSNRSKRGLYDGKDIRSGNNVSFSMRATKRKFKPNVFIKRVYSETLDGMIRFHLTTATLRSIDKAGGLDNYLLCNDNITEGEGLEIKTKILKRLRNNTRKSGRKKPSVEVEASSVDH